MNGDYIVSVRPAKGGYFWISLFFVIGTTLLFAAFK